MVKNRLGRNKVDRLALSGMPQDVPLQYQDGEEMERAQWRSASTSPRSRSLERSVGDPSAHHAHQQVGMTRAATASRSPSPLRARLAQHLHLKRDGKDPHASRDESVDSRSSSQHSWIFGWRMKTGHLGEGELHH